MAKIFNDSIINSLRDTATNRERSSCLERGETYVVEEIDGKVAKGKVYKQKCVPTVGKPPRYGSFEMKRQTRPIVTDPLPKGLVNGEESQGCSEEVSSNDSVLKPSAEESSLSISAVRGPAASYISYSWLRPFSQEEQLASYCCREVEGNRRFEFNNISLPRTLLGPYPDETFLSVIDKILYLIFYLAGNESDEIAKVSALNDIADDVPEDFLCDIKESADALCGQRISED